MAANPAHEIGYILIGQMVGLVLLGLSLVQTWLVLTVYRKDPWKLKLLVVAVMLMDLTNSVAGCQAVYTWLVSYYDQPQELSKMIPGFLIATETEALTAYICQLFFSWRVHHLRRQWWLTSLAVFFATSGVLCGTGTVIGCAMLHTFDKMPKLKAVVLVWSGAVVLCDIVTTTTLTIVLGRAITGFEKTDTSIAKVKNLILQTSGLVMSMDVMHLIIVAVRPSYMLHLTINSFLAKLYANSLLSTLNTRSTASRLLGQESSEGTNSQLRWRGSEGKASWIDQSVIPLPDLQNLHNPTRFRTQAAERPKDDIVVQVTTVQEKYVSSRPELNAPAFSSGEEASAADTFSSYRAPPPGDEESQRERFELPSFGTVAQTRSQGHSMDELRTEPPTAAISWRDEAKKRSTSQPHEA